MKRFSFLLVLLLVTIPAFAHGGLEHVMGMVARISGTSLDVKTIAGKITTVSLDAETRWMRGQATIKPADVHTGDRVVIHAKPMDGKLAAVEIAVGKSSQDH